jgi:hypothetical protein
MHNGAIGMVTSTLSMRKNGAKRGKCPPSMTEG